MYMQPIMTEETTNTFSESLKNSGNIYIMLFKSFHMHGYSKILYGALKQNRVLEATRL